ncbi:uncharacterized protein METZ01_LOCUS53283, partial [marine metagenome]
GPHQGLSDGPASDDTYRLSHNLISSAFYLADKMLPFRMPATLRVPVRPPPNA